MEKAFFLVILALLTSAGISRAAEEKPEFRGVWVSSYGTACDMASPEGIDKLVERAKQANLNALVVQVRKTGDAYYKSSYDPRAEELAGQPADFDPLDRLIKKAHAAGLEVHAWINTYKIWAGRDKPKSPDHVFNKHPEWVNTNINGQQDKSNNYGLDPGIREVQDYTANVYLDVVKNYDVDGVHFDYCRYWDPWFGYTKLALERFNKEKNRTGVPQPFDPEWCQWRRDCITAMVRQVYEGAKKIKPWVKITGSVVCSGECTKDFKDTRPYTLLLQEWNRWLQEGIIDAVMPMNYKAESDPESARMFRDWIDGMVRWRGERHVYNGISIRGAADLITQIKETRKRGADGVCGFAFSSSSRYDEVINALKTQVFKTKVPTTPMPWKPAKPKGS